jgi:hypothetical protein
MYRTPFLVLLTASMCEADSCQQLCASLLPLDCTQATRCIAETDTCENLFWEGDPSLKRVCHSDVCPPDASPVKCSEALEVWPTLPLNEHYPYSNVREKSLEELLEELGLVHPDLLMNTLDPGDEKVSDLLFPFEVPIVDDVFAGEAEEVRLPQPFEGWIDYLDSDADDRRIEEEEGSNPTQLRETIKQQVRLLGVSSNEPIRFEGHRASIWEDSIGFLLSRSPESLRNGIASVRFLDDEGIDWLFEEWFTEIAYALVDPARADLLEHIPDSDYIQIKDGAESEEYKALGRYLGMCFINSIPVPLNFRQSFWESLIDKTEKQRIGNEVIEPGNLTPSLNESSDGAPPNSPADDSPTSPVFEAVREGFSDLIPLHLVRPLRPQDLSYLFHGQTELAVRNVFEVESVDLMQSRYFACAYERLGYADLKALTRVLSCLDRLPVGGWHSVRMMPRVVIEEHCQPFVEYPSMILRLPRSESCAEMLHHILTLIGITLQM